MHDPFEESLRDLLNKPVSHDDGACLDRVLKTANRQVGAGDLLALLGHWFEALLMLFNSGSRATRVLRSPDSASREND